MIDSECIVYVVFSRFNHSNSFSRIALAWLMQKEESQKIDNMPILTTCWSGTSALLFSKVLTVLLLMEALDNNWYKS